MDLPLLPRTILVVDDDEMVLQVVLLLLSSEGFSVVAARGQDQAVALSRDFKGEIFLLLTDIRLRQGSGVEVARLLIDDRPGIRVIYMSGYPWEDYRGQNFLRPGDAFLPKPFHISSFRDMLRRDFT